MEIIEKLKEAKENSKERKFKQTWDLIINLRNIDLNKPENRFSGNVFLPNEIGKEIKVCVITDTMAKKAEELGTKVIKKDDIKKMKKRELKSLASQYDYFLGEVSLMPLIGKIMGPLLGPRGKMPKPVPPNADLKKLIESGKRSFNVNVKSPIIQGAVGTEDMEFEKVKENIKTVLEFVLKNLPKGEKQIKNVLVKLTMGKPTKIKVRQ